MSKTYVLSNGKIQVGFDQFGQVYDFYFPYVGLENQMNGAYVHKIGLYTDEKMSWLDSGEWNISHKLDDNYNIGLTKAHNTNLKLIVNFEDVVYNEKNILVRRFSITNEADYARSIKIFFNQQFEMYESYRGDTAYFDPDKNVLVHYKGRRIFLINAVKAETYEQFDEYSVGLLGIEGKEGTYRDAEDGVLSQNAIEHGLLDSVLGLQFDVDANSTTEGYYWVAAGKEHGEVNQLNEYVNSKKPWYLMNTSQNYWRAWINKQNFSFYGLDEEIISLFKRSLFVLRSHVDDTGATIASGDSDLMKYGRDTYSYVWPRDGAFVAMALDNAGYYNITEEIFKFYNDIITPDGYFMHKYRADKSIGSSWHPWIRDGKPSLPIQEDETALIVWALWHHYAKTKNIEFIEKIYNSLIKKAASFLTSYIDEKTGLPNPSYDLWEEKYGIHTFTASSVYGALQSAAKFAEILGKYESRDYYFEKANKIAEGIINYLYDEELGYFYKYINVKDGELQHDKTLDSSSLFGILHFNVLKHDNEMVQSTIRAIEEKITVKKGIGGVPRYENDNYYRVSKDTAGNPWIITTLWMAQYHIKKAKTFEELEPVHSYLHWVHKYASHGGMIAEQVNPFNGQAISATPLAWSHAEFVSTIIYYLEKVEKLGICEMCYPVE